MQEQILELEKRNERLQFELDEIKRAMKRQGLCLMRTSKGPSDTMICHDMETEAKLHEKEIELINENIDLKIKLDKAVKLLEAVDVKEFSGIDCINVDGKNWFDARKELFGIKVKLF